MRLDKYLQRMVERFAARFGRFDINLHMLLDRVLTDVLGKEMRPETVFIFDVLFPQGGRDQTVILHTLPLCHASQRFCDQVLHAARIRNRRNRARCGMPVVAERCQRGNGFGPDILLQGRRVG